MNIAFIRRKYSQSGGAELYLQRLMQALVERGHKIHIFTENWQINEKDITVNTLRITGPSYNKPLKFALEVEKAICEFNFDCVFSLERTLRQDIYRAGDGVHRQWLTQREKYLPFWKKYLVRLEPFHRVMLCLESITFNPQNTHFIIANSEMVKKEIVGHFAFPPERIKLVRNGVDIKRFSAGNREQTRKRFGINENDVLLLFAGSGWERKGLRFVLDLMKELQRLNASFCSIKPSKNNNAVNRKNFKLLVAGKGRRPLFAPNNVVFAGAVQDIENLYAAADIFILLPIYEPSANVVYEALAADLPVITTSANGASEIIKSGVTGTIINDPKNLNALKEAVYYWAERGRLNRNVLPDKSDLSIERNVNETINVIEDAIRYKSVEK
ncbi:MAG: glycosyltransferase family 4 protein [Limisphaerales bacterium]